MVVSGAYKAFEILKPKQASKHMPTVMYINVEGPTG